MTPLLADAIGWLGASALLAAYALASAGRLKAQGPGFQALNLLGAAGLLANGVHHGAWPSAGLNAFWLVIGAAALTRIALQHSARTGAGQRPSAALPRQPFRSKESS